MKKGDLLWLLGFVFFIGIIVVPTSHEIFMTFTTNHIYIGGFIKFFILATMGELLAHRITSGHWIIPLGIFYRAVIWGFLGIVIALMFNVYALGMKEVLSIGLLPYSESALAAAFFTSTVMNLTFAPAMMAFHRITDTYLDLRYAKRSKITLKEVVSHVNWESFVSFVILKTIPFFWIPAHTITFLLPPQYRVLTAAFLSIALGGILALAKKRNV